MDSTKQNITVFFLSLLLMISLVSCSSSHSQVNTGSDGLAIKGYDTVAYFTVGKPVKGSMPQRP